MAGLDYLEAKDPLDDNYYRSGLVAIGMEMGVLAGGAKLLNNARKNSTADYRARRSAFEDAFPSQDYGRYNSPEFQALKSTKSNIRSYGKAAKTFSNLTKLTGLMGMFTAGFDLSRGLMGSSQVFVESKNEIEKSRRRPIYNSEDSYFDSRAAFTSRQRAIQVIHNSQMSTRAAMGNESSFMHY